jgi:6-phosphogluconolactonase
MALKLKNMGNKIGRRLGRGALASVVSLSMGLGMTACTKTYSVGFIYVTTGKSIAGLINAYKVDYQTGTLDPLNDSPIPSGGRYPIGLTADPKQHKFLYVIHNDDSNVVLFAIGTDGKLYPAGTYDIPGSFPTAVAVDSTDSFLYVTFTYQQGYTTALQGPGGVAIFPITTTGTDPDVLNQTLGTPTVVNVGRSPVGITLTPAGAYVIEQDAATNQNLLAFSRNATTGALTLLPGQTINAGNATSLGIPSGVTPSAITANSAGTNLYITDEASNQLISYSIGAGGLPSQLSSVTTDGQPVGLNIDVTGKFLYVTNYAASTVGGYSVTSSNGAAVQLQFPQTVIIPPAVGSTAPPTTGTSLQPASVQTGTGPTCVATIGAPGYADVSHALYLYTSNALSNSVTGEQVNTQTGSLSGQLAQLINSPYTASALPTCVVSVPWVPRS